MEQVHVGYKPYPLRSKLRLMCQMVHSVTSMNYPEIPSIKSNAHTTAQSVESKEACLVMQSSSEFCTSKGNRLHNNCNMCWSVTGALVAYSSRGLLMHCTL